MQNYLELFTDSFQRVINCRVGDEDFFAAFYDVFVGDSAEAAEKFSHVDMQEQREHLRKSLDLMVYFSIDRQASDDMLSIARTHSVSGNDIRPQLYEVWLESLLKTVSRFDPQFDDEVDIAWRVVLAPGISYMKLQHQRL
ncbi:MAG: globin [Gammaproteobacteria bacterium]|nr:globin [Gammaproteobacteria bacterium]